MKKLFLPLVMTGSLFALGVNVVLKESESLCV